VQCGVVYCYTVLHPKRRSSKQFSALKYVAVCSSVMQCVAVCCSVSQCVAASVDVSACQCVLRWLLSVLHP